jgi:pterin-4a-carbinolamine dehydratase
MKVEDKTIVGKEEIEAALSKLDGWAHDEDQNALVRVWTFEKYVPTMAFIRKLTEVMDQENHHSDLALDGRSKTLTVKVTTFSANAVTQADLEFAEAVSRLEY